MCFGDNGWFKLCTLIKPPNLHLLVKVRIIYSHEERLLIIPVVLLVVFLVCFSFSFPFFFFKISLILLGVFWFIFLDMVYSFVFCVISYLVFLLPPYVSSISVSSTVLLVMICFGLCLSLNAPIKCKQPLCRTVKSWLVVFRVEINPCVLCCP